MAYPVLHDFIEKNHKNTLYKKGDNYPKSGFKAEPKRVAFLQKTHRKYKVAFLGNELQGTTTSHKTSKASTGGKNGSK